MHLESSLYLAQPTLGSETLSKLGRLLYDALPRWSQGLRLLVNEDDSMPLQVRDADGLPAAANAKAQGRGGSATLILRGSNPSLEIELVSSKLTLPFESNRCSVEITANSVEGQAAGAWLAGWFRAACGSLLPRYASAYAVAEREHKNIVADTSGYRAVGVDFDQALPGLYWLNYFGPAYVELMGRSALERAPAHAVEKMNEGVLVQLHADPHAWNQPETIERERRLESWLGSRYFFSKSEPSRHTVAPNFWAK